MSVLVAFFWATGNTSFAVGMVCGEEAVVEGALTGVATHLDGDVERDVAGGRTFLLGVIGTAL
jgi:hypothetical protein